jgi:glycogen debranching enzyme
VTSNLPSKLTPRCQYIRLPPPVVPYVLRISLNAGSLASKAGVLLTNFPLDGSAFDREKFHQRK